MLPINNFFGITMKIIFLPEIKIRAAIQRMGAAPICGGDRNRTGVQTYSSKAFYMFILFYYVGNQLGTNNRLIP